MTTEQASFRVGGDYYQPANGGYLGVFKGTRNGPAGRSFDGKPPGKTILWMFDGYNLDGTPLIDPKTGGHAVIEGMTSDSVGVGQGVVAKGRIWLTAVLAAKGIPWTDPVSGQQVANMVASAVGATVALKVGNSTRGKSGTLLEVEPYIPGAPVAAVAPVAPVAPLAPAAAPTPMMPAPMPVAVAPAPLAVPAAASFVPSAPAPVAVATAPIPAMPFPAATA